MRDPDESEQGTDRPLHGDAGSNLVEYAMLMALIVIACLSAMTVFGRTATGKMSCVGSAITIQAGNVAC